MKAFMYIQSSLGRGCLLFSLIVATGFTQARAQREILSTPLDVDGLHQETCISQGCHEVDLRGSVPRHLPYLEGQCLACHVDHTNEGENLLKPGGDELCLACHTNLAVTENDHDLLHPPGEKGCVECHDPHESPNLHLVRSQEILTSCAECHSDFLDTADEKPFRHDFFDPVRQCGICHYAHQNSENHFLRDEVGETCLTCHDLPIRTDRGPLEDVEERLRTAKYVHGAMKEGACPSCHTPHGSIQESLLLPGYPAGTYENYDRENYALCWKCHDSQLVEEAETETATGFRDGALNLHSKHVLELRRGRACHICHSPHASDVPHLLKEEIKFKNWTSPMEYKELANGGTCLTPCHREKEYVRGKVIVK